MTAKAEIYLAGGCFWGTEHFLKQIDGVLETEVGYANGHGTAPSYEQVCTDKTGFAEAVHVTYDPRQLPLSLLVQLYFQTIDPTSVNRQGNDRGTQYRTGIYYKDPADRSLILAEMAKQAALHHKKTCCRGSSVEKFLRSRGLSPRLFDEKPERILPYPAGTLRYGAIG